MEVFMMIHQHEVTIFSPAEELSTMVERLVEDILKWPPVQQWLYTDNQLLDDSMTLAECRYSCQMDPLKAPVNSGPGSSSRGAALLRFLLTLGSRSSLIILREKPKLGNTPQHPGSLE
uniref:Ubiquitin-like domain-containing protein n=1 Tax=Ailuropoda melanoleuca TaxID=9646 RepID=A0A7N5JAC4_AILME